MTFPEMIYQVTVFLFSDLWKYLGLLLVIITIRGDVTNGFKSIGGFIRKIKENYKKLTTNPGETKKNRNKIELG